MPTAPWDAGKHFIYGLLTAAAPFAGKAWDIAEIPQERQAATTAYLMIPGEDDPVSVGWENDHHQYHWEVFTRKRGLNFPAVEQQAIYDALQGKSATIDGWKCVSMLKGDINRALRDENDLPFRDAGGRYVVVVRP